MNLGAPFARRPGMIRVAIANPQETVPIDRTHLREVARRVLEGEDCAEAEISLAFVDNSTIQRLNRRYLQHDQPTDVLSFPFDGKAGKPSGEIVIGAEVAREEANRRGHEVQVELALYVIHGLLHLCGYDDKTAAGVSKMRKRERHYLELLNLPDITSTD
jgi:probable rRNA maturation factor